MTLKVGCLSYINALPLSLPFLLGKVRSQVEWIYDIPNNLNKMVKEGQVDIALTSSVSALDPPFFHLPGFGIVASQKVLSVNLYTRVPLFALDRAQIAVTDQSATAVSLLKVLCFSLWKIEPQFVPYDRTLAEIEHPAFLLIGDEALRQQEIAGFTTVDLASAWYELTSLPFVFALFVIREGVSIAKIASFRNELNHGLLWSENHPELVEQEAVKRSHLNPDIIHHYYSQLRFRLGREDIKSLNHFKTLREAIHGVSTVGA
jgi:predicted solute-binding protein